MLAGEVAVADGGGDALDALGSPHGNGAEGDEVVVAGAQTDISLEKQMEGKINAFFFSFVAIEKTLFYLIRLRVGVSCVHHSQEALLIGQQNYDY